MSSHVFQVLLAITAGVLLAAKSGLNARLGVLTRDTLLATSAALLAAAVCVGGLFLAASAAGRETSSAALAQVPLHLWLVGGLLTAIASLSMYWLIPRAGISSVIALGLAGQLVTSLLAGHFGWFELPPRSLSLSRALGACAVLSGALVLIHEPQLQPRETP